jgi:hypothetical protein
MTPLDPLKVLIEKETPLIYINEYVKLKINL